jgi:hypothetical protein
LDRLLDLAKELTLLTGENEDRRHQRQQRRKADIDGRRSAEERREPVSHQKSPANRRWTANPETSPGDRRQNSRAALKSK